MQDLLKCLTMYDRLPSAGQVWKQLWKILRIRPMSKKLNGELGIWALVRSPDKFEASLKET